MRITNQRNHFQQGDKRQRGHLRLLSSRDVWVHLCTTRGKINLTTHSLTKVLVRYGLFLLLEISSYSIRKLTHFYLQFALTTVEP